MRLLFGFAAPGFSLASRLRFRELGKRDMADARRAGPSLPRENSSLPAGMMRQNQGSLVGYGDAGSRGRVMLVKRLWRGSWSGRASRSSAFRRAVADRARSALVRKVWRIRNLW